MTEPAPRPDAVLVDGYNLLHAIPRFAPRGAELAPARAELERWLAQAAARHGVREVVIVWDGRADSVEVPSPGARERRASIRVLFTAPEETADERLLALCRGAYASRAARVWVVSSDRDVRGPARELGFAAFGAMEFFRRWSEARPRGGCAREGERARPAGESAGRNGENAASDKPRPTRADVNDLLEQFLAENTLPLEDEEP